MYLASNPARSIVDIILLRQLFMQSTDIGTSWGRDSVALVLPSPIYPACACSLQRLLPYLLHSTLALGIYTGGILETHDFGCSFEQYSDVWDSDRPARHDPVVSSSIARVSQTHLESDGITQESSWLKTRLVTR